MRNRKRSPLDHLESREAEESPDACFYRIIFEANRLVLSRRFSQVYGDELSKVVRLILPAGGIWKVGLEKLDNVCVLSDGWQKFVDHHSIFPGHFLLFNYRGNSEFNVSVFDLTATEIQYPSSGNPETCGCNKNNAVPEGEEFCDDAKDVEAEEENEEEEEDEDDNDDASITILDSPPTTRFRSSLNDASTGCSNKVSRKRTREVSAINLDGQSSRSIDALELESSKDLNQETCSKRHKYSRSCSKRSAPTALESERALNAAKLYKSINPSFIRSMKRYNVHTHYNLHLPTKFSREYLQPCPDFIELQDSDNEKWCTHCVIRDRRVWSLGKGWSKFVQKEELNIGDVCVFELIQTEKVVLKVTIFRGKND